MMGPVKVMNPLFFFKQVLQILLVGVLASATIAQAKITNPAGFEIERGVNLSHWLSQDFGWFERDRFITENDLRYIASMMVHMFLILKDAILWMKNFGVKFISSPLLMTLRM